jgi:Asp-tRNA(Asn)/Glu-tRNA(Gln) amidotransferase A subunit family amidase
MTAHMRSHAMRHSTHDRRDAAASAALNRRQFMTYFSAAGLAGTAFPAALWRLTQQQGEITKQTIADAEAVAGLDFTDQERDLMLDGLQANLEAYKKLRAVSIPNDVPPALRFDPVLPGREPEVGHRTPHRSRHPDVHRPDRLEDVAFWSLTDLGELIRSRQVSSVELTELYLHRLRRFGPKLEAVITLTEDLAHRQALRADEDLRVGRYHGPLHGIPWGAKDLLAEDRYPTTWGAKPFEAQVVPYDATVVRRLEDAGAVLVAKLTLGALAMGDVWYGGRTRNPWNTEQGSSGSSAGPASATVSGLIGFSIGSETLGSIVSPSTRCGASGLRPTFGRVSRWGAMALSWSMDKLGPICRSVEDCALVFAAIQGADGKDPTARDLPFDWDPELPLSTVRVGYYRSAFESDHRGKSFDDRGLAAMRKLGVELIPIDLPVEYPVDALHIILDAESGAAFDELTRSNRDDLLVRQTKSAWPNLFRESRFIPAVEYIQANRVRTMLMGAFEAVMEGVDVFITPSYGGSVLLTTNLTGHPAMTVPNGFADDGTPVSISFIGRLYGEAELLAVAKAFQDATGYHLQHPPEFR